MGSTTRLGGSKSCLYTTEYLEVLKLERKERNEDIDDLIFGDDYKKHSTK